MNETTVRLKKANAILKRGRVKDALSLYADIIEDDPENPLVYYNMGVAFIEKDDFDLARQVFQHCLKLGLESDRVYIGLGICYLKMKEYDQAFNYFEKVTYRDESYNESLIGKVYTLVSKGEAERATPYLAELKSNSVWNQELALVEKTVKMKSYYDSRKK
ncbi:MAG TPA: tetratricopeptide repeat protein [Thermotogota bacterium]|nr:tetratricopeptide repeat protein [Thermotogota bacterium]HPJ88556.1 tetratricopeptide repeat protein [Thermotogota bacterium]HPR96707.1 tetratricopeptide repeat protein [Thermotogota bacterium]